MRSLSSLAGGGIKKDNKLDVIKGKVEAGGLDKVSSVQSHNANPNNDDPNPYTALTLTISS